ncbi:MAG: DUF2889 domain-containing protein [Gammaproteobacteria bacterium]|nr:DUF2889 domain-containing protein [Gammaproteobacteria bacterium]NNC97713.1 DUF2889 domain-containing protein [Gammaproteobacteria bacterium]NNM14049.1 DUF2889 domain-containing protein [Gammaproteobacteria bacterium]
MPLSEPVARQQIHQRLIDCIGYEREDGLFDIEGRLTDTKSYAFDTTLRGHMKPGDYIHDMKMRLTVDTSFTIVDIEAVSDHHPYPNCGVITPNYKELIGQRIVSGFTAATEKAVGQTRGCTHHTGLLRDLATVVFQTLGPLLAKRRKEQSGAEIKDMTRELFKNRKPPMIDGCHALARDNENVKRFFPDWYMPKNDQDEK